MAAFVLFALAVAGGMVVADLVLENTAAGQITVFHHIVAGYPEGWRSRPGLASSWPWCWSPPSTQRRDDGRAASNSEISGMAWSTRWLRPSLTMPGCWMRSSALRSPPATSAGHPGQPTQGAKARRAEPMTTKAGSHPSRSSPPPSRSTSR
jgi:hypothetical protein